MKQNAFNISMMVVAMALVMGFASVSVAQPAPRDNPAIQKNMKFQRAGGMPWIARFQRDGRGMPPAQALTDEQIEKLKAEKAAFQTATQDLRMELQSKRLALKSELVKKEPDAKTAKSLQKEISSLTSELAMKRLEHVLEMKKIAPYGGVAELEGEMGGTEAPAGPGA